MLLIIRCAPYQDSRAQAAIDATLAYGAFEQPVTVLLQGNGVLLLHGQQNGRTHGRRDIGKQLASLPLYDIEKIYVDAAAARDYGIACEKAPVDTELLDIDGVQALLTHHDHILSF